MARPVLTVSLNAAIDLTYLADNFGVGKINLVSEVSRCAGGKANNVARVLASLGVPVIATGFAGGPSGQFIQMDLQSRGIRTEYVPAEGENRTCTAVVDPVGKTLTEVRERGPLRSGTEIDRFRLQFRRLVPQCAMVILSGSLPPGLPPDFYGQLVSDAYQTAQVRTIVDASGAALKSALPANPYMIKPNLDELEEWVGAQLSGEAEILAAADRLLEAGALVATVSLGAKGLLLVAPEGAWRALPPPVEAINTVGSGDSLVAGFAAGIARGLGAEEILRLAVGCGTANALTETVASVRQSDLEKLLPRIRVERIR